MAAMLEITVGHWTLSDQIFKNNGQFCNRFGHDVQKLSSVTTSWKLLRKSNFFTVALMRLLLSKMVDRWTVRVRHRHCLKSDWLQPRTTIIISKKTAAWTNERDLTKGLIKNAVANLNVWSSKCCLLYNCKYHYLVYIGIFVASFSFRYGAEGEINN